MKKSSVNNKVKFGLIAALSFLSACDNNPAREYPSSGNPEGLIDLSSETVTLSVSSKGSLSKIAKMVEEDRPSGAELRCSIKNSTCAQAKEIFESNSVPIRLSGEITDSVVLVYERVIVRDCDQRFVDNMSGDRSYNHPSFGCAVAANMLQMVSDKRQFTNPSLMDMPDAEKAVQSYNGYLQSSATRTVKDPKWSTSTGSE